MVPNEGSDRGVSEVPHGEVDFEGIVKVLEALDRGEMPAEFSGTEIAPESLRSSYLKLFRQVGQRNAAVTVAAFAEACEVEGLVFERSLAEDEYYCYAYYFSAGDRSVKVLVPGCPLEEMRKEFRPPRFLIGEDLGSWCWEYAIGMVRDELVPLLAAISDARGLEGGCTGLTDNDLPAYIEAVRAALLGFAKAGVVLDPNMELTPDNLRCVRAQLDRALEGIDTGESSPLGCDAPKFLDPDSGFDIEAIAAPYFPGMEYRKPVPGFTPLWECASVVEYRAQVIPSHFGDLHWVENGYDWMSTFKTKNGKAFINIDDRDGRLMDRYVKPVEDLMVTASA